MDVIPVRIEGKESVKEAIIAIGENLKERAEDIANDLDWVREITIYARINPMETVTFEVKKEYMTIFKGGEKNGYKSDK